MSSWIRSLFERSRLSCGAMYLFGHLGGQFSVGVVRCSAVWTTLLVVCGAAFILSAADCVSIYVQQLMASCRQLQHQQQCGWFSGLLGPCQQLSSTAPDRRQTDDRTAGNDRQRQQTAEHLASITICNLNQLR